MLYVTRIHSKKSNKDFIALCYDLGYRSVYLSFDRNLCAELLNVPVRSLEDIDVGEKRFVE